MNRKQISFSIPWPTKMSCVSFAKNVRPWLPSRGNVLFTLIVVASLVWASKAGALSLGTPMTTGSSITTIAYQGRLGDINGVPVNRSCNMYFSLYTTAVGGTPVWSENWDSSHGQVEVSDGLFNVMLGTWEPIQSALTENNNLWLGIKVCDDPDEMSPRVQLGSVPIAFKALTVPDGSITAAKLADGAIGATSLADGSITTAKLANGLITSAKLDNNLTLPGTFHAGSVNADSFSVGNSYGQIAQGLTVNGTGPYTVTLPSPAWAGLLVLSLKFYGNPAGALIWVNSGNGCGGAWDSCATATIVAKSGLAWGGNSCNVESVSINPGYSSPLTINVSGAGCSVAEKKAYVIGN